MNRLLQSCLGGGLAVMLAGVFLEPPPAPSQAPGKLVVDKADHKSYVDKLGDKVSFEMVPIPGGTFMMGSPAGEKGRKDDEGPQHPVAVKPFWMGKMEVTWDEYDLYRKEEAVEAPRLHVERDGTISFEPGLPEAAQAEFLALGDKAHPWPARNLFFGGVHAARRRGNGSVEGAGDPRRQGMALAV